MSNPYLNDRAMASAAKAGWAAPDPGAMAGRNTPLTDGPVSSWRPRVMTVQGTATATGVLLVLLLASATVGWMAAPTYDTGETGFPALAIGGVIVGLICAIVVHFKPMWARVLGPVYAVAEGFFLGVISKAYESYQDGVVVQAIGATVGVFAVMLFMYRTQIIKVTDRFKRIVIGATLGLMAFYLVSFVINIFGGEVSFFRSTSWLGIGFSLFAAGLAAMNLALDFDFIEKGSKAGMPKAMEWFAAFGLLITLVWLYLELLRLLSKLNQR